MTPSLLAWADNPSASPCPLHPNDTRRRRRDGTRAEWRVGHLPYEALAHDLAVHRSVAYREGVGYLVGATRVSTISVTMLAADLLDEAADLLYPWRDSFSDDLDVITPAYGLRATATSLRDSPRAGTGLVALMRPFLPSPAEPDEPPQQVSALEYLARFDTYPEVKRSTVWKSYDADNRPGNLAKGALFKLAQACWGEPVLLKGYEVFRPARAAAGTPVVRSAPDPAQTAGAARDEPQPTEPVPVESLVQHLIDRIVGGSQLPASIRDLDPMTAESVEVWANERSRTPSVAWGILSGTANKHAARLARRAA